MSEIDFIEELLADVGPWVAERFRDREAGLLTSTKSSATDLVTEADVEAQRRIRLAIEAAYPTDRLVAEESGFDRLDGAERGRTWVVDPIDGTHNFARGLIGAFGVSIGLLVDGQPVAGGIVLPASGRNGMEMFLAERGAGTRLNGTPVRCSAIDTVALGRMEVDLTRGEMRSVGLRLFDRVMRVAGQLRCTGSSVVSLCGVACGCAEAYMHAGPWPWDIAAGVLLVTEAGGVVSDERGGELNVLTPQRTVLATNGLIHRELVEMIKGRGSSPSV